MSEDNLLEAILKEAIFRTKTGDKFLELERWERRRIEKDKKVTRRTTHYRAFAMRAFGCNVDLYRFG